MDVEMQLEANGLPVQFSSSSDLPHESHVADNLAATTSNAEATVSSLPTKPAVTESSLQDDQIQAVSEPAAAEPAQTSLPTVPTLPPEITPPAVNGDTDHDGEAVEKSTITVPDSQPPISLENNLQDLPTTTTTTSISDTILTDSFIPSSIPIEVQSSATPLESSHSAMELTQPPEVLPQAPVSDLRTEPHSDALTTEAVAEIEAQKHELDNAADAPITLDNTEKPSTDVSAQSGLAPPVDQVNLTDIGLPSPTQSPPPAPQPTHATLPADITPEQPNELELRPSVPDVPSVDTSAPAPIVLQEEEPAAPAPTPTTSRQIELTDQIMTDAPSLPIKQARERDEDTDSQERATKRARTDDSEQKLNQSAFKVPEVPTPSAQPPPLTNGGSTPSKKPVDGDDTVTAARLAHMKKVISNLKKSNASTAFRQPVDWDALKIPQYPEIVKEPMDLSTIDQRLKHNKYSSVSVFIRDFELIVQNCFTFNGPDHGVSQQAKKMQSSFNSQMNNLPKATVEELSRETKKATKKHEPTRSAPPRRPSISTSVPPVVTAPSPKTVAPPTPSFAPGPDGIPLIRRDSSLTDGRPKRAIVPTKRNQEFGGGRPKKKKYELQLRFCEEVLKEISSTKLWQINQYFTHAVDPVALNIPTYFQIIKKPMDLGTVKNKLQGNNYEKAKDFEEDVRLVFKNCYKFNPEGDLVNNSGHQLEEVFNKKWATKDEWIASREPQSEPPTDADEEDDEEEDSEDEADNESEDERNDKIKLLQKQIEMMSKQMGELTQKKSKKSKSPPQKKTKSKPTKKEKHVSAIAGGGAKEKKEKKKSAPKSKADNNRFVTFAEKQYISNGIAMLPEKQMQEALKIIQSSVPALAASDQSEIELDIEDVPNHALIKLLNFIKKYAGPPPVEPKVEQTEVYSAPAATKHKKNKPMTKHEQEAQIEELKGKLGAYAGGGMSPDAVQSIEDGDSSDDDGDSEESEEE